MPTVVFLESLRVPCFVGLVALCALQPGAFHHVLWAIAVILATVLALVFFNIAVLLVYIRYFLSPTKHKPQDFRPLRFASEPCWSRFQQQRRHDNEVKEPALDVAPESRQVSKAFEELLSYVLRDFLDCWFGYVAGPHETSFRNKVDELIRLSVLALKRRVQEADLVGIAVNRLVPIITAHISDFRAAEIALRGRSLERSVTQSDELDMLLALQFRNGRLHSALTTAAVTTKPTEVVHLRKVVERVLPCVIGGKELKSGPVATLIREIVSCAVLQPVIDMLADPDYWNLTIDAYLGKVIREQKMVHKLREVLNRHSTGLDLEEALAAAKPQMAPNSRRPSRGRSRPELLQQSSSLSSIFGDQTDGGGIGGIRMGKRSFQEFLRMIEDEKNLLELKRVRNDIVTQLRKKKVQIHGRDPDEVVDGEKVADITVYLNRLAVAKKRVDKRIALLTGQSDDRGFRRPAFLGGSRPRRRRSEAFPSQPFGYSLDDILANPAGMSYFMEFMDRRGSNIMKLQFWLVIEGFKNTEPSAQSATTFLQDANMVYTNYLMEDAPHHIVLPDPLAADLYEAIGRAEKAIQDSPTDIPHSIERMRLRLYEIQRHVFYQLEKEHFPFFKRSDLYFKFLASTPNVVQEPPSIAEETILEDEPLTKSPSNMSSSEARPALLQRTSSHGPAETKSWDAVPLDQNSRAESDTELNNARSALDGESDKSPVVVRGARGHVRAISETAHGSIARLLGLGKLATSDWTSANDWQDRPNEPATDDGSCSSNSGGSKRDLLGSLDTDESPTEDESDQQSTPAAETTSDQQGGLPPRPSTKLVGTNTVKAVEAELQSIIDWDDTATDEKLGRQKIPSGSSTPSLPSKSPSPAPSPKKQISSPLLLRDSRGAKSTMAQPVQYGVTLQSWTPSKGSSVVREVPDELGNDMGKSPVGALTRGEMNGSTEQDRRPAPSGAANVHLAPPGDLMLSLTIERLSSKVEKLTKQEAIVDHMIRKAQASHMVEKLRILEKSRAGLRFEIQKAEYQKKQYEMQESENVLIPHRTKVSVTSSTIGSDGTGEFALYVIEMQQLGCDDGSYSSGWMVARRYSEFFALHAKLKDRYPVVKSLEFPAKWPLIRLQKAFVEARRTNLERYLRRLLEDREICKSKELRAFLSQQSMYPDQQEVPDGGVASYSTERKRSELTSTELLKQLAPSSSTSSTTSSKSLQRPDVLPTEQEIHAGFMRNIYKSVAEGVDDLTLTPDMLEYITQQLVSNQFEGFIEDGNTMVNGGINGGSRFHASPDFPDPLKAVPATEEAPSLTEPLCDLFVEMFELKEKNNWLRRQALVIILQQILGGTIERKLRDTVIFLESESMIAFYLRKVLDSLWPGGQSLTFKPARRPNEKQRTKEAANRKLSTWLPDLIGQMVGRQNARRGARRLFTVLQNKRLNQDLLYTLFDEIVSALFPEVDLSACKM